MKYVLLTLASFSVLHLSAAQCATDLDCDDRMICWYGMCHSVSLPGQACSFNEQCTHADLESHCHDGICKCLDGMTIPGMRCSGEIVTAIPDLVTSHSEPETETEREATGKLEITTHVPDIRSTPDFVPECFFTDEDCPPGQICSFAMTCEPKRNVYETCKYDEQCQAVNRFTECLDGVQYCSCYPDMFYNGTHCEQISEPHYFSRPKRNNYVIIGSTIAVSAVVTAIGLVVFFLVRRRRRRQATGSVSLRQHKLPGFIHEEAPALPPKPPAAVVGLQVTPRYV